MKVYSLTLRDETSVSLVVDKGIITDATPSWMKGKTLLEVKPWLKAKGAKGEEVKAPALNQLITQLQLKLEP